MLEFDSELFFRVALFAFLIPIGSGACINLDLGLGNGRISDGSITTSSVQSANTPAKNGRLNYTSGSSWCARTSDTNPYLQIDLQTLHIICAVSTQGNSQAEQWVKTYKLQLSTDGTSWTDYKEGGQVKFFLGNDDRNSILKHVVYGVLTRYLRFLPQTHQGRVCMRTEVFGVKQKPACYSQAIGVTSKESIPDKSFSASTYYDHRYIPSNGRLNGSIMGWAPETTNNNADYLEIDLLFDYVICAVATQGAKNNDEWTTKYKIRLSLVDANFDIYQENNTEKIFDGNSGRNDIVKHGLGEYTLARFIHFVPTAYHKYKALRVEVYGVILSTVPSQAPSNFTVTAISSTRIRASWTSLPEYARHGTITGYNLLYREKGSVDKSHMLFISEEATLTRDVINLDKYTKYEFQVLAVGSHGEGPKSSVKVEQTLEDAPSTPSNLVLSEIMPDKSAGPKIKLTWHKPAEENGIIRSYTVFYNHDEDPHSIHTETLGGNLLSYIMDVFGGVNYHFHIRAVTIKPGPNATASVRTKDYEPSVAPSDVFFSTLNQTTFNISWSPLSRKESYSKVMSYEIKASLKSSGSRKKRSPDNSKTVNTTRAFVILYDIQPCYSVTVRAYTLAGPGPSSQPLTLEELTWAPNNLGATNFQSTEMTLEWERPQTATGENWKVEYSGKKTYNNSFLHKGNKDVQGTTRCTLDNLVPGTKYEFQVYGISECGNKGSPTYLEKETEIGEPLAPVVPSLTIRKVSESQVEVELWPAEQRNGPISAYQVIVLRVVDGVEKLPTEYKSQLEDSNKDSLNFYVAAEIENIPVFETSRKFTVGDGNPYGKFVNKKLERGDYYIIYQRAITEHEGKVYGEVSEVARISVEAGTTGLNAAAVAVPMVLLLLLIPAVVVAVFFYRRRKLSRKEGDNRKSPAPLNDIQNGPVPNSTGGFYENVGFVASREQEQ
ncbi:protein sidekick-1-like, partial [Stylophora pistillata]|uniref:protein sidekick-1-like n=1 Tax=Stylophora pistillata TaxID=50429 RepID=UPI000C050929